MKAKSCAKRARSSVARSSCGKSSDHTTPCRARAAVLMSVSVLPILISTRSCTAGASASRLGRAGSRLRGPRRRRGSSPPSAPAGRPERFDAVRVIRSCLTLERRLLRDRGIDLDFTTALEATYLKGDPNALFDLLVNLVRNAAEAGGEAPSPVTVQLEQRGTDLELTVRGRGSPANLEKVRGVAEGTFGGTVSVKTALATGTTWTIALPLPAQREADRRAAL